MVAIESIMTLRYLWNTHLSSFSSIRKLSGANSGATGLDGDSIAVFPSASSSSTEDKVRKWSRETAVKKPMTQSDHCSVGWNCINSKRSFHWQKPLSYERVSERAKEWAQQSAQAKRAVRSKRMSEQCEQTSKRRSEWPSTLCVNFVVILPTVPGWIQQTISAIKRILQWVTNNETKRVFIL